MSKLKVLDLFSGIGGFSLGLHGAGEFETVGFCEFDNYCQKVLSKNFPSIPIFSDIRTLTKEKLNANRVTRIDIICGGFPCQPFSNAGKKKGRQDDRDLWPEMFRVIKETKPTWVIGENVAGFIGMEFTRTKVDLEGIGYRVLPFTIPACAIGAQHRRDRVWIIAHLDRSKLREQSNEFTECESERFTGYNGEEKPTPNPNNDGYESNSPLQTRDKDTRPGNIGYGEKESSSNADSNGLSRKTNASKKEDNQGIGKSNRWTKASFDFGYWWANQSTVGRDIYGFSRELDRNRRFRVKALGNSIVPAIVTIIGKAIIEVENASNL